jgi:hypothetical protein
VDHAGTPGLLNRLLGRPATRWVNLFSGSPGESAVEAAPLLLDLQTPWQLAWLQWLQDVCRESSSLTLLHSALDLSALARSLKRRLEVMLPDGVPALLRYFDTRILESLYQTLEPEQKKSFFGIAACWQWLDRAGNLQQFFTEQWPADSWPDLFVFSEKQQNAMIDAAEADVVVQQMQRHGMDLCTGHSRAALHRLARECLVKANQFSIEGASARTLFALAMLELGADFPMKPQWRDLMALVQQGRIKFEDVIRQQS